MLSKYFPSLYVNNIKEINFENLYHKNIKALIFDIDNTLVHHGEDSNSEIDDLFKKLKSIGFKMMFVSDNSKERIERFNKNIKIPYIEESNKPFPQSFLKAVEMMNVQKSETLVIGDQIFKDILGANNAGLKSILVHFIRTKNEKWIGFKRYIEAILIFVFKFFRLQDKKLLNPKKRVLFCQRNPLFYKISVLKEKIKRHLKNFFSYKKFALKKSEEILPVLIWKYESDLIKRGKDIDETLQKNKAININIACRRINKTVVTPGQTFSFWKTIGKPSAFKGYKNGRSIVNKKLVPRIGGGLCNLGNTIHLLVLHSPLDVTEVHFHSDCLALEKEHKIMSSGTSVDYNYIDFRFKNNTDQTFQFVTWVNDEKLFAELRAQREIPYKYELTEENRHYEKEDDTYFCISKIFQNVIDKKTNKIVTTNLIRKNHSEVMFSYDLIT